MKWLTAIMIGAITVLLAIDFFTEMTLEISAPIFVSIIIGLILIELIVNRNNRHDAKVNIRSQLFVTAYLVAVIGLFELLGGESSVGISLTNWLLWLVVALSLFDLYLQYRKDRSRSAVR